MVGGGETLIAGIAHEFYVDGQEMRRRLGRRFADNLRANDLEAYRKRQRELMAAKMMDAGVIPPWFPIIGECAKCGPVPLPRGPLKLDACVWCDRFGGPRMTHDEFVRSCEL